MFDKSSLTLLGVTELSLKNTKTEKENKVIFVVVPNSFQKCARIKVYSAAWAHISTQYWQGRGTLRDLGEVSLTVDPSV